MSVTVDLRLDAQAFELGRILQVEGDCTVELDRMVPLGQQPVPFFWVYDTLRDSFEDHVGSHPAVDGIREAVREPDRALYAIDWRVDRDTVFEAIRAEEGQVLSAAGTPTAWEFELRFHHHECLSRFRERCSDAGISLDVLRVSTTTSAEDGPWYGLTCPQREALVTAVERGYYEIPRRISTQELADELSISDQATTERLRRGIDELVRHSLIGTGSRESPEPPAEQ